MNEINKYINTLKKMTKHKETYINKHKEIKGHKEINNHKEIKKQTKQQNTKEHT